MCLLFHCRNASREFPFILLANRDEFYERPTRVAEFWPGNPGVLAGKDLKREGTWLGITRSGRWAALTNYREPSDAVFERSRGDIVREYLTSAREPREYGETIQQIGSEFDGFNLLFGDRNESLWLSNRHPEMRALGDGIYGLSNHLLETPWPKVVKGKQNLAAQLTRRTIPDQLFESLIDETVYDENLPNTGLDPATERMLSSAFISSPEYGTRSSTLITMDRKNEIYFEERTYDNRTSGPKRPDEYDSGIFIFRLNCTTL